MIKYFNNCRILKTILKVVFAVTLFLNLAGVGNDMEIVKLTLYAIMIVSLFLAVALSIIVDEAEKELSAMSQNIRRLEDRVRELEDK